MKKRNIIIITTLVLALLLLIGFYLKSSKNIESSTNNKNYSAASINFENNPDPLTSNQCLSDKTKEEVFNLATSTFKDVVGSKYFQIINGGDTNLGYTGYVYIVDGCTYARDGFIDAYNNTRGSVDAICSSLKANANTLYLANDFNASKCVTTYGYSAVTYSDSDHFDLYDFAGTDSIGDYVYYENNSNNTKCYYAYSKENTGRVCNYAFDSDNKNNIYLINGCSENISIYLDKCQTYSENKCGDTNFKNFLTEGLSQNNYLINHIDAYNKKCSDKINYGTVVVYQNDDAYGLKCGSSWTYHDGGCKKSAVQGTTITGPDVSTLYKYGTKRFKGWSTDKSCTTISVYGNTLNVDFTGNRIYYACYEDDSSSSPLFISNVKQAIDQKYTVENNTCDESSMTITDVYYRKTTKLYEETLNNNAYCNVVCEDTVNVTYPNIFETVPAGQYFELMYEPEVSATRTCTSEFNYIKWKNDYQAAINNEVSKMDALNKAEAKLEAAEATSCEQRSCCESCDCEEPPCGCCTHTYRGSASESYYTSTTSSYSTLPTQSESVSGCGYSSCADDRAEKIDDAQDAYDDAFIAYKDAVNKRILLERNNLQCYTILDQDNNSEKKYEDIFTNNYSNLNDTKYNINTPKVSVNNQITRTSGIYSSYITGISGIGITSANLTSTDINLGTTTIKFYAVYPQLNFKYDDGREGSPQSDYNVNQELDSEAHLKIDTGSYTSKSGTIYTKDATSEYINKNFCVNGSCGNQIFFNPYKATKTMRKVQYYFTYHESEEYLSKIHSGATILNTGTIPNGYVSLSRKVNYTDKTGNNITLSNHNYPVSLKAVTDKYKNQFVLSDYNGLTVSNNYFNNTTFSGFTGEYNCNYEITNDTLTLSGEKENFKDLKSNTLFRSVATNDLDPNNRASKGNLGENWMNKKGQAAKNQIEASEGTNGERNTFNPDNLEYSFTLTPTLIKAIKEYNQSTTYDDFNLTCATEDGRECISEFLTNLASGQVKEGGILLANQGNYSEINSWGEDDLVQIRKEWKYYIDSFASTTLNTTQCTSYGNKIYECNRGKMTLDNYLTLYEKWGVLP